MTSKSASEILDFVQGLIATDNYYPEEFYTPDNHLTKGTTVSLLFYIRDDGVLEGWECDGEGLEYDLRPTYTCVDRRSAMEIYCDEKGIDYEKAQEMIP